MSMYKTTCKNLPFAELFIEIDIPAPLLQQPPLMVRQVDLKIIAG